LNRIIASLVHSGRNELKSRAITTILDEYRIIQTLFEVICFAFFLTLLKEHIR